MSPTSDAQEAVIAVLDVGKTNIKMAAATGDGVIVDSRSIPNPTRPGPPWVHHDLPAVSEWVFSTLAELCRIHPLAHFIAVGHGVSGGLVGADPDAGGDGLVLPMIDYEQPLPDGLAEDYAPLAGGFFDRGSTIMMGSTHQARQLYWMQRDRPKEFAAARWALGLPQYWAWRVSGRAVSERSYLGAQSHLWNVRDNRWSPIVAAQNWQGLMPPLAWAWDAVGPIRPELAARYGLPRTIVAHAGAHDSSANLYRYQCTGLKGFTLMSTGTWLVGMANDVPLDRLDEGRGMTCNLDVFGQQTGGALVMGGREFEQVAGDADAKADADTIARLVAQGTMALPAFGSDDGQFPGSGGRGRIVGPVPRDAVERRSLAVLYAALLTAECAGALADDRRLVVDGVFLADPAYGALLAVMTPAGVMTARINNGVTVGAALLCRHNDRNGPARPAPLDEAQPMAIDGLVGYRERWRRQAAANAKRQGR